MTNLVSIVLPVYNGAKYVGKSIESVLSQSYKDVELIIVNDCSTDNTLEVISEYAQIDPRVKIVNNNTNMKLPRSLNIGFSQAKGKYWSWTSDDNYYKNDAVQKMVDVLDNNQTVDLVYTNYSVVDMNGNIMDKIRKGKFEDFLQGIGACFLYKKELAIRTGEYNTDLFLVEDYDFFIRCYQGKNFYHLDEDLYCYGMHDNNLTTKRQKEIRRRTLDVINIHFDKMFKYCNSVSEKYKFMKIVLSLIDDENDKKIMEYKFYGKDYKIMIYNAIANIKKLLL